MTPRHPITPAPFDPHAHIDGPAQAWSDPELSRLDLMENREWVREAVARHRADEPDEGVVDVFAVPHPPIAATDHCNDVPLGFPRKGVLVWIIVGCVIAVAFVSLMFLATNMQGAS